MVSLFFRLEQAAYMFPNIISHFNLYDQRIIFASISAFMDDTVNCVHKFLQVFVNPCYDFHDGTMKVFNAVLPEIISV